MSELIRIILDKPEWALKIDDDSIVETWYREVQQQGINSRVFTCVLQLLKDYKLKKDADYEGDDEYPWDVTLGVDLETDLGDYCHCSCARCEDGYNTDESMDLEDEDDDYKKHIAQVCLCTEDLRLVRFQTFLDKFVFPKKSTDMALKAQLVEQVGNLERSFSEVDYHPGSNNQVIDLVHPSLHCYVKDVTQLRNDLSTPIPVTDAVFQWLPAEVTVHRADDSTVSSVSIDSYINNLPRAENEALYDTIGAVFGQLVPQFDQVLQALHDSSRLRAPTAAPAPLAHCQVIVKLANIVVAPGEVFPGGHWHLEGMQTERIVATGIYYYDMTNLQDNALEFRSTISDSNGVPYPQNGASAVYRHFGLVEKHTADNYDREMESTVDLGAVQTSEDLMLVFPNFLQHKVSEVRLEDAALPGTRKILCFFLINPYEQVLSTAHVAPQQRTAATTAAAALAEDGTMALEDAKLFRELLMFQRKYQIDDQTHFFERGWSLCEH